jgi:selenide,water dikinase
LSDIYAMGGRPFLALNIAALPTNLPDDILAEIIRGGAEKAREAGVVIAGGHTVQDTEPKYGLVVVGFVDPRKMLTKSGARPGDRLILTKPLGFGVTTTALKREIASPEDVVEVVTWMKRLNNQAGEMATQFGLRGATDVTGFSLLGHASEMARASGVGLRFHFHQMPFVSCARKYAEQWAFPGGASDNRLYFGPQVDFDPAVDEANQMLLYDSQTSGGLLLCVPPEQVEAFKAAMAEINLPAWEVGEVLPGSRISVLT